VSGRRAIVREVNERIHAIHTGFGIATGTCLVLCECGGPDCRERIEIPVESYEALRVSWITAPGHAPAAVAA
jgi:hypothetical protein